MAQLITMQGYVVCVVSNNNMYIASKIPVLNGFNKYKNKSTSQFVYFNAWNMLTFLQMKQCFVCSFSNVS